MFNTREVGPMMETLAVNTSKIVNRVNSFIIDIYVK